jgi:hypothetical protein
MLSTLIRSTRKGPGEQRAAGQSPRRLRRLAAGAAAVLPAVGALGLIAPGASASGPPLISILANSSGTCTVSVGSPCSDTTADISVLEAATDPANSDVAIVNTADDFVYLLAGTSGTQFGISVTAGNVYLIGGNGSSTTALNGAATASGVKPGGLAFDANGNLVFTTSAGRSAVDVIANGSTTSYGYSTFSAGDLYEIATTGTPAAPVITLPAGTTTTFLASGLVIDSYGDIIVAMKSQGIFVIDEQAAPSVAYGQALTPQSATFIAGSPAGGSQVTLSSGATALSSGGYIGYPRIALDGYNNLVFTAISSPSAGTTNDTVWVLPATAGTAAGAPSTLGGLYGLTAVTAGDIYPVAGSAGVTTESLSDVSHSAAAFNDVIAIAIDPAGNIVLGDQGANYSLVVLAESATPAYGIAAGTWTLGDVFTISGGASASSTSAGPASAFELPPVWTVGYAGGDLFVAGYNSDAGTPAALYELTNAPVPAATITQQPPLTGNIAAGTAFSGQLVTSGQSGIVTFTTTTPSPSVSVSASGAISAPSTLAAGPYTVSGTDQDTFGNTGTWTFTLTVGPSSNVPESPLVIGLPIAALLLGGAALWMNRRRRRPAFGGQASR